MLYLKLIVFGLLKNWYPKERLEYYWDPLETLLTMCSHPRIIMAKTRPSKTHCIKIIWIAEHFNLNSFDEHLECQLQELSSL